MRNGKLVTLVSTVVLGFLCAGVCPGCATAAEIAPKISFILPPGNIYGIGDLPVSVSVANFTVVDKQGQPAVAGEGHLHYFLDVDAPVAQGKPAVAAPGTWATTASTSYTWHNVGSGQHIVSVELVNNDHTPLNPPVVARMPVLVIPEPGMPSAVILQPLAGTTVAPGDVTITVEVNNLLLVANAGQTPAPGEGHIIYYMDVETPTDPGKPATTATGTFAATEATSYTWHNVSAGLHTFRIELVNDDDTPLSPAVVASVTITVSK